MAKTKVKTKKTAKRVKRYSASSKDMTYYGLSHEFVIITGGGFLIIILAIMFMVG